MKWDEGDTFSHGDQGIGIRNCGKEAENIVPLNLERSAIKYKVGNRLGTRIQCTPEKYCTIDDVRSNLKPITPRI